ncbi:MAG: D-TA family PLP-dependent enzyme [Verrucomicrobia bacterium]|nr:D-TA family PLP-dependent enzyme [Verrucomicrobiota bacterium]
MTPDWLPLLDETATPSPALLVSPTAVEENLRRMIAHVGDPTRLRPHIKTHKLPQIVALQVSLGITKCKCATIAEAEMAAGAGAQEITVATQLVGPNVARFLALQRAFPLVAFSTIADDPGAVAALASAAHATATTIELLLDLDVGMARTGIAPGPAAAQLYRTIATTPGLRAGGLHAYDGHLRQPDFAERCAAAADGIARVDALRNDLVRAGVSVPRVVWGGTPTFPVHARRTGIECSPGTCVLWDASYRTQVPDLDFLNAAVLLTRVISRPGANRLCLDLGHKAVASEMPHPRAVFPAIPDARAVTHSEEHLVIETARAAGFSVGTALYALPWHICPTVALHDRVQIVRNRRVTESWPVVARARRLQF